MNMTEKNPHVEELGRFLRARRRELTPGDLGLPTREAAARRVSGLRQEEVAESVAISHDYYTRMEQGPACAVRTRSGRDRSDSASDSRPAGIKPENLLLTTDGFTLVADFGIARALAEADERLAETGLGAGTPTYLRPEQAAGGKTLDARTDVYSLGAVLYEMLAGEPPFTG
jgi:hypothetical protein